LSRIAVALLAATRAWFSQLALNVIEGLGARSA
jgi:hypothetical protein